MSKPIHTDNSHEEKETKLSRSSQVNSVLKTLRILDCFTPAQPEVSLTQLSEQLDYPKSTLLNQIRTLEEAGYLYRVQNSRNYKLGFKIMELSYCVYSSLSISHYAVPLMEDLQNATGEIIYLTTHVNGQVLFLECTYPAKRPVRYSVSGKTLPMHCTSSGKAMLCYMAPEQVDGILSKRGMPAKTVHTITNRELFDQELERTRNRGYAIDVEEETLGVKCVASAIRDSQGNVAGAISVSGSVLSITDDKLIKYAQLLSSAANTLSQYAKLFPAIQLLPD